MRANTVLIATTIQRERNMTALAIEPNATDTRASPNAAKPTAPAKTYAWYLLFIAGMGGLLYGVDVGIIASALLYLDKTINLTVDQTSIIVAAVLGGSMLSSVVAGVLADWLGRKTMMIVSGLMFVVSVGLIVISQDFLILFTGRLLQGMSGGVIAVVVPLYLAECLSAGSRGRGTGLFQFMLTIGIVLASVVGFYYTHNAQAAIAAAAGDPALTLAAESAAWRNMFLSVVYPGVIFMVGAFFLSESPRWLYRRGKRDEAMTALKRSCTDEEAQVEWAEIEGAAATTPEAQSANQGSLFKRKYIVPFVLACLILGLNQTTGINSILAFVVIILKQAGFSPTLATQGDIVIVILNSVMTLVAVALVDTKGRTFLLKIGTSGIIVALIAAAVVFHGVETERQDVRGVLQAAVSGESLSMPLKTAALGEIPDGRTSVLTVYYGRGSSGEHVDTVLSSDADPVLHIAADPKDAAPLVIKRATFGPVAKPLTGWLILGCLSLFIASFAIGPGVVVWLALSELMPTRIRSTGMGIALLVNQGASTVIAAVYLPVVGYYGYSAMFIFWAGCTVLYFLIAAFFMPETKGKSLEEIDRFFDPDAKPALAAPAGAK
jgi:SP family myo-inositol transporter-like MFS transporter 13